MGIFLVNQDDPAANSLMEKLVTQTKPNAIIPLTTEEMDLYCSRGFQHVSYGEGKTGADIVELDPGKKYVAVVNEKANIDDITRSAKYLGVEIAVVRVYG